MEKKSVLDLFSERNDGQQNSVCPTGNCSSDDNRSSRNVEADKGPVKDPLSLMPPEDAEQIRRAGRVSEIDLSALSGMWSGGSEVEEDMSKHQFEKKGKKRRED